MPVPLLDVVSLFDGEHSLARDPATWSAPATRARSPRPTSPAWSSASTTAGFLDAPRLTRRAREVASRRRSGAARRGRPRTRAAPTRRSRPALRAQIDGFFAHADGPGPGRPSSAAARVARPASRRTSTSIEAGRPTRGPTAPLTRAARTRTLRDPRHLPRGHGRSVRRSRSRPTRRRWGRPRWIATSWRRSAGATARASLAPRARTAPSTPSSSRP